MMGWMTTLFTADNLRFLFQGLGLTLGISVSVVVSSIVFGTIIGLFRHYQPPLLGKLTTVYVEILRNTPLLLWMLACAFLIPVSTLTIKGSFALFLYTSAVIAEIIRGGLNSIPDGQ